MASDFAARPRFSTRLLLGGALAAICALLSAVDSATAEEGVPPKQLRLRAETLERPPTIDGRLDEWSGSGEGATARLGARSQGHPRHIDGWTGPEDASAEVRLAVHGDHLYLGVRVTDDLPYHDAADSWWHWDSLELFIDADRSASQPPGESFTAGCWQVFLMPLNPEVAWGVVFRGQETHFDDGGLRGVEIAHRVRSGGYDFEVALPLVELGIVSRDAREIGFALALNDSDEAASTPGTYLSWNEGQDLYRHPNRFGVLELPARSAPVVAADKSAGGWPLWTLLAALLALAAAVLFAGIGARRLAQFGPRPKLIGLALVGLLAAGLAYMSASSRDAAAGDVRAELSRLGEEARTIVADAQAAGALRGETPSERAALLRRLLSNEPVPALPGVEAAAMVPLHPGGAFQDDKRVVYSIPLADGAAFDLPERPQTRRFEAVVERAELERGDVTGAVLGTVTFTAADGTTAKAPLMWPAGDARETRRTIELPLDAARTWTGFAFAPTRQARGLVLKGLSALEDDAAPDGANPERTPLALPGRTREGVPVLAHARGPDHGVRIDTGERVELAVPELLGGADRLWLLLRPERAFPDLLGDDVLAKVRVTYGVGDPAPVVELRNGEHLSAERQPQGLERPATMRSRVAFVWRDTLGYRYVREAIALPLETERRPERFTIENTGPGALRVVAATVVRTRALAEDSTLSLVTDEREPADRVHLRNHGDAFQAYLDPAPDSVRERITIGEGGDPIPLQLHAPLPQSVSEKAERTTIALLTCLALGLFLLVLLVVDVADRLPVLSRRLGFGVLAAALVPLAVTILLVDRTNEERVTSAFTERALTRVGNVESRMEQTLRGTQRAARRLAAHLASSSSARDPGEVGRLVRLFGGPVLPEGASGSAIVTGAEVSGMHVPLGSRRRGLKGTRYLPATGEPGGFHVSPWDGLVVMATARRGSGDRRVNVTLGIGTTDAMLSSALGGAGDADEVSAAVLDASGRVLAQAGVAGGDLGRAIGRNPDAVRSGLIAGGPHVFADIEGDARRHLAVVKPLSGASQNGAWLVLGFDRTQVERELAAGRETLIWLSLFGLVLIVSVAALMARRVAAPVRNLVRATDAVRRGTFDVGVEPTSGDEIGELTVAFDQMRLDLKHRVGDLDFLRRAQDLLSASLDVGETAERTLSLCIERTDADEGVVLSAQGYDTTVAVLAARGAGARFGDRPFEPGAGGWIRKALSDAQVRLVHHETDGALVENESGPARRLTNELGAWLTVPLWSGRELQGLVVLGWKDPGAVPSRRGQRLLLPLAGIAASALNNARLYRLASLDDVTRLPGATAFEAALRDDVDRAISGGSAAVLLRVGLDHLEHVTLRRGVEDSRLLLRTVAEAMRGIVGERGKLGRLRGEELAVRLPGANLEDARKVAEVIRERVAKVEVSPEASGEPLITTASIGIARAPEDAGSVEFLLDAAGRALSAAQREGGDRVEDVARVDQGAVDMPPFEEGAIFRNERMVRVVDAARRAARSEASILITGETGTGKEVIATLVHRRSARAERPFVTVNCAAFPETLLESELFGHERGAFTGAERRREGRFELADGGTLFLDEIAEMTPSAQVKLLRVLQERQFTRLGGTRTITVDVRIIAATNRDLERAVKEGVFREDLYYRLNVIRLELPPLRDRREEIPFLVEKFLADFTRRAGRGPRALAPAAMDVLYRHPWPGNVRELKNTIERCAVMCEADVVGPEHLQIDAMHGRDASSLTPRSAPQDDLNPRQRALLEYLARHGRATNRVYYEMTGTSPRTALRDLQDLMNRGLIIREGKRRGAVYRLV